MTLPAGLRVAIIHDWLTQLGGAEKVLEELLDLFPAAHLYTSLWDPRVLPASYQRWAPRTTFLQRLPLAKRLHRALLPLYPLAFESLDLAGYDLVLSNSSGFCHLVITAPETYHVNYCLTPPRFLWNSHVYLERERVGRLGRALLPLLLHPLRLWDSAAATRVDQFVGISRAVVARIAKVYRRQAELIYPPVDTSGFSPNGRPGEYFLMVSRLIPYKRVDLAVRAFKELRLPLWVVGDGRDRPALEAMAGPNVRFLGRRSAQEVADLMAGCRALVWPGEEDFGIAPVEAQAAGRPVIAYAAGGALDTVDHGRTGLLFTPQTAEALAGAVQSFHDGDFSTEEIARQAQRFDRRVFRRQWQDLVADGLGSRPACRGAG